MARYGAFLRGINLGAHHRVTNDELRAHLTALGLADVATFRASGNVVFSAPAEGDERLAGRIERGLRERLGYDVATFVRSAAEVGSIASAAPFTPAALAASTGKLQVALLGAEPDAATRRRALALATDEDLLALDGRELYWLPRARMTDSPLELARLEATVGAWTMRTKATIEQLAARHLAA